mgnify:CR=1 FL=1
MKKSYLLLCTLLCANLTLSQEYFESLPENPDPNKCFAKCVIPDEYAEEIITIIVKPEHEKLEVIPAVFKTKYEEVIVRPASMRFVYVPAVYETVVDTIWIKDKFQKLTVHPAEFERDFENIEIKPSTGNWVAGEKDPDCPSIDKSDCRIFHFVESPAVVREVPIEKLKTKETTSSEVIAGDDYVLITKQVEVTPAHTLQEQIPEKTQTVERQVLVSEETTRVISIPEEQTQVIKKTLTKKGGTTAWREVPCTIPERGEILPIHYALGHHGLTPESKRIIDQHVLSRMKENKSSLIEIGSHTDARGSDSFNQSLSELRAKSVIEYLISKGIEGRRLIAVGYGESKLLNNCGNTSNCSENEHAENRRTEFKVF